MVPFERLAIISSAAVSICIYAMAILHHIVWPAVISSTMIIFAERKQASKSNHDLLPNAIITILCEITPADA